MWRWSLVLICLVTTELVAQSGHGRSAPAKNSSTEVEGFGLTDQDAKNDAIEQILKDITILLGRENPPLTMWRPTIDFVRRHVLQGKGSGADVVVDSVTGRKWVYPIKTLDVSVFRVLDQEARRVQRSEERIVLGMMLFAAGACVFAVLAVYGKVRWGWAGRRGSANRG